MPKIPINLVQAFGQALQDYSYLVINKVPIKWEVVAVWILLAALATGMAYLHFDGAVIVLVTSTVAGLLSGWTSGARKDGSGNA